VTAREADAGSPRRGSSTDLGEGGDAAAPRVAGPGRPQPLGATITPAGVSFALVAPRAAAAWLVLWPSGRAGAPFEILLEAPRHRSGDVWHVEIAGAAPPLEYGWRLAPEDETPRDPSVTAATSGIAPHRLLLDPYARAISGAERWGAPAAERRSLLLASLTAPSPVERPRPLAADRVIYELGVRAFTAHPSSRAAAPGTFDGLREKIPYLRELGVTTVELLPVTEWDELEVPQRDPTTGEELRNLWGYSPIVFSAPKASLALASDGGQVAELRGLVGALHAAGIEVVLDLVFNHTAERDGLPGDPVFSVGGIDRGLYYLDNGRGEYLNFTGCGNTVAVARPPVADLVLDALRWWATEIGVDGFRFDLAAALTRGLDGRPLVDPPFLARLEADPVLADRLVIAEAWDAGGLHRGGDFARRGRWAEWNDRFRDDVRRFVRGEPGMAAALATRLGGSEDLFREAPSGPLASVNYVTCHDGPTLADLVTCERKHNERNGQGNRDGPRHTHAWNCGVEGPTGDPAVLALRRRQVRNLLTLLFVAQGVPMVLAGDELGRTQGGNDNAWCQDNEVGWVDWGLLDAHGDLHRFVRGLLAFRRAHPVLRRSRFLTGRGNESSARPDVTWHGTRLGAPDWGPTSRCLAMHLAGEHAPAPDCDVYLAANAASHEQVFELPPPQAGQRWLRVAATWLPAPDDLRLAGEEEPLVTAAVTLPSFSTLLLRSG
jgi:isoamylase